MRLVRHNTVWFILAFPLLYITPLGGYSMLSNNDPLPFYSSLYPYDYLSTWERDYYRGLDENIYQETWELSISPFRQTAETGKNLFDRTVPLGDLYGRWNMLGLFYPSNATNPGSADPFNLLPLVGLIVTNSQNCTNNGMCNLISSSCCPTVTSVCDSTVNCPEIINPQLVDPTRSVGFFSIPMEYRKYGVRFQYDLRLVRDFGIRIQFGAADITQTITQYIDLTLTSSGTPISGASGGACDGASGCLDSGVLCKEIIHDKIMTQREVFMRALRFCDQDFHTKGLEDTIINLFWQKIFPVNDRCDGWPFFLWVPHVSLEVVLPTSHKINPSDLFAIPLGNNGHAGFGFDAGMDFDFINSIEIGIHASMTKWTNRRYCNIPVPTSSNQSRLYPFRANFTREPGTNWTFMLSMNAHYFLDRLSGYAAYQVVNHSQDKFCDITKIPSARTGIVPTTVLAKRMSELSRWRVHVFDFGLNYDIAPHASLGFFWQSPWARTNAYRSTTVMLAFNFRF
jgi:hypothetical protein